METMIDIIDVSKSYGKGLPAVFFMESRETYLF